MLSVRHISVDALITNELLSLGFLLLLPYYYCSSSTFPDHDLTCFISPVIPTSYRCTSSSYWEVWWHLFFGFPKGLLLPKLPSRISFVTLLSNIPGICPARFIILTCIYVTKSVSVHSLCSALLYCIFQTPFFYTGPEILRSIFLSKEPYLWDIVGKPLLFTSK